MSSNLFTEAWLDGYDGHRFYTRTYTADNAKAVLIFIHGFADHISRYEDIHSMFAQQGITVFAYDMRGFGRTALDEDNRSPDEYYGKTSRVEEFSDLEHWVRYVSRTYPNQRIFLLGYSAAGGMVLSFATQTRSPPSVETVSMLSGIIAQVPLVAPETNHSMVFRWIVRCISKVFPTIPLTVDFPPEWFSRDPSVCEALANDPLRMSRGTLRGLSNMVVQGDELLAEGYQRWPKNLPILMTWGTVDKVNSYKAGVEFYNKLVATDKKLLEYEGAYHDLLHEADDLPKKVVQDYISWIEAHLASASSTS